MITPCEPRNSGMLSTLSDRLRHQLGSKARLRVRAVIDPLLSPVGSAKWARRATDTVALTFDDGPDENVTPRLLDLLARRGTKATFFVLTDKLDGNTALLRRAVADGHEIGLHGDRHDRLPRFPPLDVRRRLAAARARLEGEIGAEVTLFRPPFGAQSIATYLAARSVGLRVIVWSAIAEDWLERPAAVAAEQALATTRGGDILLLHDGLEVPAGETVPTFDRVSMVEQILDGFAARGLRAVTVGKMIAESGTRPTAWFRN